MNSKENWNSSFREENCLKSVFSCKFNDWKVGNERGVNLKCFSIRWPTQFAFAFSFPPTENWENRPVTQNCNCTLPTLVVILGTIMFLFMRSDYTCTYLWFFFASSFWRRKNQMWRTIFPLETEFPSASRVTDFLCSSPAWRTQKTKMETKTKMKTAMKRNETQRQGKRKSVRFPWRRSPKLAHFSDPYNFLDQHAVV